MALCIFLLCYTILCILVSDYIIRHCLFCKYLFSSLDMPDIVPDTKNTALMRQMFCSHGIHTLILETQAINSK